MHWTLFFAFLFLINMCHAQQSDSVTTPAASDEHHGEPAQNVAPESNQDVNAQNSVKFMTSAASKMDFFGLMMPMMIAPIVGMFH